MANPILLQKKYARVIECFAKKQGISLDEGKVFLIIPAVLNNDSDKCNKAATRRTEAEIT